MRATHFESLHILQENVSMEGFDSKEIILGLFLDLLQQLDDMEEST